ncbi:flavin reductase [Thermus composti]|uniref:Flavin reductase family protein n=1 Tax=Thermus composti TaxID=532059 RepID=A0ABV6Q1C1_9DEIN|nr:flavin reductase family protein [Thermus composti]GGN05899.1 flavin reductase [Thermus composti]
MNAEAKKKVLRSFTYGLYILTAQDGEEVAAGTVNWVTQASFTPPLVALGVKRDSHLHALIERTGRLALMTLAEGQKAIAQDFFKPTQREGQALNGHPFEPSPTFGLPLLTELPYWLEAEVREMVKLGDHSVVVAEVVEAGVRYEAKPLVMWDTGWFYGG